MTMTALPTRKYGAADIVTKKQYRDFRLHIEFLISKPGATARVSPDRYESRCSR